MSIIIAVLIKRMFFIIFQHAYLDHYHSILCHKGGNDIKNAGTTDPKQLVELCAQDSKCLGFNTNGWMKKELKPRDKWDKWTSDKKKGFYVKKAGGLDKFHFYPYLDSGKLKIDEICLFH